MEIFSSLDFSHLQSEVAYIALAYIGVVIAMLIDLATGVRKAVKEGRATTSRGFRRTAEKASLYFLPMICLTAVDILASEFLDYPFLTAIWGVFNIYIEVRSIYENTHTQELANKDVLCARDLVQFISEHKEDIDKLIGKN